jgi:hypothetical protein
MRDITTTSQYVGMRSKPSVVVDKGPDPEPRAESQTFRHVYGQPDQELPQFRFLLKAEP